MTNPELGQDGGACVVAVDPNTLVVRLQVREPLAIAPQTVVLGIYDFIQIFGAAFSTAGAILVERQRQAQSRIGVVQ